MPQEPERIVFVLDPDRYPEQVLEVAEREGVAADLSDPVVRDRVIDIWRHESRAYVDEYAKTLPPGSEVVILQGETHGEDEWSADNATLQRIHELREKYWADTMMRLNNDVRYSGYQLIFIERNMVKSPVVKARLDAAVEQLNNNGSGQPVLVLELGEPPELSQLADRSVQMLGYSADDANLTEQGRQARAELVALSTRIDALETLKDTVSPAEYDRIRTALLEELARIRSDQGEQIVHNEPEKWLRTAANDTDILFQYLAERDVVRYFGIFIYTDLDRSTRDFVRANWDAIDQVTGPSLLVFAFEETDPLVARNRILSHAMVVQEQQEKLARESGIRVLAGKDVLADAERSLLRHHFTANESAQLARRLNVPQKSIPCLLIFDSMDADDIIVYSFRDEWIATGEFTARLKELVDLLDRLPGKDGLRRRLAYIRARRWLSRNVPKEKVGDALRFVVKSTTGLGG